MRGRGETERAVTDAEGWALYVRTIWKDGMLRVCWHCQQGVSGSDAFGGYVQCCRYECPRSVQSLVYGLRHVAQIELRL